MTVTQLRAALPQIEKAIAREGEVVVTRRGRPVARLLPIARHAALRARMPLLAPSGPLIREDR